MLSSRNSSSLITRASGFVCSSTRLILPSFCPTELVAFNKALGEFEDRECVVLTASTDSVYSHKAGAIIITDLKGMKYLMIGDTTHDLARTFGVLKEDAGIAYRGRVPD